MDKKVCVNCHNEKPINSTYNRLVTESCGHVKCIDCLFREKTGCNACFTESTEKHSDADGQVQDDLENEECSGTNGEVEEAIQTKDTTVAVNDNKTSKITHIILERGTIDIFIYSTIKKL